MIPISSGLYIFEFEKNNVPQMNHAFVSCEIEKGYCQVCGKSTSIKEHVQCSKCGLVAHQECCESAYTYCETKTTSEPSQCISLEEYLSNISSTEQKHYIVELESTQNICQTCNLPIQNKCYQCLCCDSTFHIDCKIYNDCKFHTTQETHHHHHLLQGAEGKCFVCKQPFERKIGFHCVWCDAHVHKKCLGKLPSQCSYGQLSRLITKPNDENNTCVIDCREDSDEYNWTLLHLNPRQIVKESKDYLTPIVIHCHNQQDFNKKIHHFFPDDNKDEIEVELKEFKQRKDARESSNSVVVTKGDLAKTLGWNLSYEEIMYQLSQSLHIPVDIWSISDIKKRFCCYFGLGIDAYHMRATTQGNVNIRLEKHIHIFLGDKQLYLEGLCGIILMNIPYYDGCKFVDNSDALLNDRMIEIIGFTSPNHFTLCQNGNVLPNHIGTARTIKIIVVKQIDCQVDGIPFILPPGVYNIKSLHQLHFLSKKK